MVFSFCVSVKPCCLCFLSFFNLKKQLWWILATFSQYVKFKNGILEAYPLLKGHMILGKENGKWSLKLAMMEKASSMVSELFNGTSNKRLTFQTNDNTKVVHMTCIVAFPSSGSTPSKNPLATIWLIDYFVWSINT